MMFPTAAAFHHQQQQHQQQLQQHQLLQHQHGLQLQQQAVNSSGLGAGTTTVQPRGPAVMGLKEETTTATTVRWGVPVLEAGR